MTLQTVPYNVYLSKIPKQGKYILAQQTTDEIIVYQAFNPVIAKFAVAHQYFGGSRYSYNRMSWIKPNFHWMMYRCGWCEKEDQKRVLAIWIKKTDFDLILKESVHSSFQHACYENREEWKSLLTQKEVRMQWDPDHDPFGGKEERRAIQLGLKGNILEKFGKEMILKIEDITPFVKEQKQKLDNSGLEQLTVPMEEVYRPEDMAIAKWIGID